PSPRSSRPGSAAAAAGGPSSGPDHGPARGVQNGRIWTALILIRIQPDTTQVTAGLCAFFLRSSIAQRDAACRCYSSTRCSMTSLKVAVGRGVLRSRGANTGPPLGWISYDLARALCGG